MVFLLSHSISIQHFNGTAFFMFVTHFNERIVIKTVKWISYDSLSAAYISQLAIHGYAGHMTERLSTRMGTVGQGSSWISTSNDLQGVGFCSAQLYFSKDA